MAWVAPEWEEHQHRRWLRHDAHRFVRPGYEHLLAPAGAERKSNFAQPHPHARERLAMAAREAEAEARAEAEFKFGLRRLRVEVAELRFALAMRRLALRARKYSPDQPRVPAGNPDGWQWTRDGGANLVRLASSDKPRLGRSSVAVIALELAKRVINAYRSENGLRDLFGRNEGTVTVTTINGSDIFGSNSRSPTYTATDYAAAEQWRDELIARYPNVMKSGNVGERPNDALFHAEATVMLRAARVNGGTLAGRSLEVFSDRPMCPSCNKILPLLGRELGNPTVIFVGPTGIRQTLRNGVWVEPGHK